MSCAECVCVALCTVNSGVFVRSLVRPSVHVVRFVRRVRFRSVFARHGDGRRPNFGGPYLRGPAAPGQTVFYDWPRIEPATRCDHPNGGAAWRNRRPGALRAKMARHQFNSTRTRIQHTHAVCGWQYVIGRTKFSFGVLLLLLLVQSRSTTNTLSATHTASERAARYTHTYTAHTVAVLWCELLGWFTYSSVRLRLREFVRAMLVGWFVRTFVRSGSVYVSRTVSTAAADWCIQKMVPYKQRSAQPYVVRSFVHQSR